MKNKDVRIGSLVKIVRGVAGYRGKIGLVLYKYEGRAAAYCLLMDEEKWCFSPYEFEVLNEV